MKAASPLRLRRIRFKDGRTITVFRPKAELCTAEARDTLKRSMAKVSNSETGESMVGFGLVAWARDGSVYVNYFNSENSGVPAGGVAGFVYDTLLAEQAARLN